LFAKQVTSAGLVGQEEVDKINEEGKDPIHESVKEAKEAPDPGEDKLLTDVYVTY